jgi:iron(III) transport system ATP-binding protein
MNSAPTSLSAHGVSRVYDGIAVVSGVSLDLQPGAITALLGGSGAGKSTLLRLLAGLEPVDTGKVCLGDVTLSEPGHTLAPEKRRIGLIFQDFALFPHLTALQNVGFGLASLPKDEARAIAAQWLSRLGLGARSGAYPHELSGGEQQRVAIARARKARSWTSSISTGLKSCVAHKVRFMAATRLAARSNMSPSRSAMNRNSRPK